MSNKDDLVTIGAILLFILIILSPLVFLGWVTAPSKRTPFDEVVIIEEAYRYQDSGFLTSTRDKIVVFWNSSFEANHEFDPEDDPEALRFQNGTLLTLHWELREYPFNAEGDEYFKGFSVIEERS